MNNIKAKESLIKGLILELKNFEKTKQQDVEVSVYEGKEGMRTLVNLAFKTKEFCSFGATGKAFYELYEMPALANQLKKEKLKVKIIGGKSFKEKEPFKIKRIEYKYVEFETDSTTSIFGDYVSIHLIKDKPFFVLIKNKSIANSYKKYFDFLWKSAKK